MVELVFYKRIQLKDSLLRCKECGELGYDIGHLLSITEDKICTNCYIKNGGQIDWLLDNIVRKSEFRKKEKE